MKKYRLKKGYTKQRIGLILAVILVIAIPIMWVCSGSDDEKSADRSSAESTSTSTSVAAGEEAKTIAKEINGMEFNVLVGSKVPLEKAVQAKAPALPKNFEIKTKKDPDFTKAGSREVKVTVKDKAGDKAKAKLNVTVIDKDAQEGDYDFITNNGFVAEVRDGVTRVDGIVIVNKAFSVPESYGEGITKEAYAAFEEMQNAASEEGVNLWIRSEYRSYIDQKATYDGYVKKEGKEAADRYSARPGYSEHQTGEAMDINTIDYGFGETKEGAWMNDNCAKYGLVIRFPKGKEKESGYKAEPWHIRYVGKELAPKLYNNGDWITIEEYFGLDCEYTN